MVFKLLYSLITRSVIVALIAFLSVNHLPDTLFADFPLEPVSIEPKDFDSVIPKWNNLLSDKGTEYLLLNQIVGAESLAISPSSGLIYSGLADGRLIEIDPSKNYKFRQVLRFLKAKHCADNTNTNPDECGRILQVRFVNSTLYGIEASTGLFKIDVKSGQKTLVAPKKPLSAKILFNSFVFDPVEPNIVYISVSSTKWPLSRIIWSFFDAQANGRLIAVDLNTNKQVVVLDNLVLANGVDVDPKRNQLLLSECFQATIHSINLKDLRDAFKSARDGETLKSISKKPLIPLLPGLPDNIIVEKDTAYIALPFVKTNGREISDHLGTLPNLRKSMGRIIYGAGKLIEYVCVNVYYHPLLETAYRELKSGHLLYRLMQTDKSAIVVYNLATGSSKILGSDSYSFVSEAVPDGKGNLLLGSFRSPFIVKVALKA